MQKLHPDIRNYYIFRALLKRFVLPILVVYGLKIGLSLSQLSIIAASTSIVTFLLEIPSGAIADTLGHRKTLIISMLGQAAAMALYLGGSFAWFFAGAVLYFGAGSLMTGTAEAYFYERLQDLKLDKDHARLYGGGKAFATGVSIVSMLCAGFLYEIFWALPFLIGIAQFLLAAFVVSRLGETKHRRSIKEDEGMLAKSYRHFGSAWKEFRREPRLFWVAITSALIIGPLFGVGDFQQAAMQDVGISVGLIGVIYAGKRLLSILLEGKTHALMKRFAPPIFTSICAVMMVGYFFCIGLITNPYVLVFPLLFGSLAWVGLEIATNDYTNQMMNGVSRATVLSMNNFLRAIVITGSIFIFGLATKQAPAAYGYLVLAIVFAIILPYPLYRLRQSYRS